VNNWGEFGRWGYLEVRDPARFRLMLDEAIEALYADRPIIGLPT
jgi:type III restriction enzyme